MAKKKEKTTKSIVETPTKQVSQPSDARDTLLKLAQILLPVAGIFAALSYFLGRLHIEAYYYALGITPHVLRFSTEDYMFSSFNLVIMCLEISLWLYLSWRGFKPEYRLVLGFPIAKGPRKERVNDIFMLVFIFVFWILAIWNTFIKSTGSNIPGIMGLNAGFVVGIGAILLTWYLQTFFGSGKKVGTVGIFVVALALFALIPFITARLAQIEAEADIKRFPQAVLICADELPNRLQSSPSTPTQSSEVKLIITNNGMTYVMKQKSESTNEWQIYAIPEDDIKQIIYLHAK